MEKNAGIYFVAMNIFGIYQVVCCNKRVNKLYACRLDNMWILVVVNTLLN